MQKEDQLELTERIKNDLLNSAKWGKFLAIIGYIGMGLLAIIGFFMLLKNTAYAGQSPFMNLPMRFAGIIYLIMAVIYYFPVTYLYRYAEQIKEAVLDTDQDSLSEGFYNLSRLFTFMGILTIIVLVLYALALVVAIPMLFFIQR